MTQRSMSALACLLLAGSLTACSVRDSAGGGRSGAGCDPGISDTSVLFGTSIAMSGPVAAYAAIADTTKTYFDDLNADGGVKMADGHTRKVELKALDDAYDPARTVANVRELVQKDQVFALEGVLGTSGVGAISDYVVQQKIPNVFPFTGTDEIMADHADNPWTTAAASTQYAFEGLIWAKHVEANWPGSKVGILYQNDGFGQDILAALEAGLEGSDVELVAKESFEQSSTSVDSQVVNIKNAGADVFVDYANGTFMTQSLQKVSDLGWDPELIISPGNNSNDMISPAGAQVLEGAVSYHWLKDVASPDSYSDGGIEKWQTFAKAHDIDPTNQIAANGYATAQIITEALEQTDGCTRQDFLDAMTNLDDAKSDLLMPDTSVSTTPDYPYAYSQVRVLVHNGTSWDLGDVVTRGEGLGAES